MNQEQMQIRISSQNNFIEFEVTKLTAVSEPQTMPILEMSVRVQWQRLGGVNQHQFEGFKSGIQLWHASIEDFIAHLESLETVRQGEAKLAQMGFENVINDVKSPFTFKIFSIDTLGHMAVSVELRETIGMGNRFKSFENSIAVTFEVDTSAVPALLADFKELVSRIKDNSGTTQ